MNQNLFSLLTRTLPLHARPRPQIVRQSTRKSQRHSQKALQQEPWWTQQRRSYSANALSFGSGDENNGVEIRTHVLYTPPQSTEALTSDYGRDDSESTQHQSFAELIGVHDASSRRSLLASETSNSTAQVADALARLLDLDYVHQLPLAIARKEPDLAARCIFAASRANDAQFLRSISDSDFSAVLDLLKPSNFLNELIEMHVRVKNAMVHNFGLVPVDHVAKEYEVVLQRLIVIRRGNGCILTLSDYESILEAAKELQLPDLARKAMNLVHIDGHKPTTKCYNGLIGATAQLGPVSAVNSRHDHVTPFRMRLRQAETLSRRYMNFRVGVGGIAQNSDILIAEMQYHNVQLDEESYCLMITAYALEGQIRHVAAILKNVWHIDVELINSPEDGQVSEPLAFEPDHPVRPSKRLLFAVTRAYCINNDMSTALKLLEYICRHYQVPVDDRQWRLLLEWVHILSVPRLHQARGWHHGGAADTRSASVELSTMQALWTTMTEAPYNVEPTTDMFDFLIRNLRYQDGKEGAMLLAMEQGRDLFRQHVVLRARSWVKLESLLFKKGTTSEDHESSIENAIRAWELAKLRCARDKNFLQSWLHYYLTRSRIFALTDVDAVQTAVGIPNLLNDWCRYLPRVVEYYIPTGHVQLEVRTADQSRQHRLAQTDMAARRLEMLASHERMIDAAWITNWSAPERARASGFAHTFPPHLKSLSKHERGWIRPSKDGYGKDDSKRTPPQQGKSSSDALERLLSAASDSKAGTRNHAESPGMTSLREG